MTSLYQEEGKCCQTRAPGTRFACVQAVTQLWTAGERETAEDGFQRP